LFKRCALSGDGQNEDAKDYAYGMAEEIKKELDSDDSDSTSNIDDDRQFMNASLENFLQAKTSQSL